MFTAYKILLLPIVKYGKSDFVTLKIPPDVIHNSVCLKLKLPFKPGRAIPVLKTRLPELPRIALPGEPEDCGYQACHQ